MPDLLLDTSVCIHLLRGHAPARSFVAGARRTHGRILLHTAVLAELYAGAINRSEFRGIDALVVSTEPAPLTSHDLSRSLTLLRRHNPSHGVGWHDCLIAATALRVDATVATLNERHFTVFRGLRVVCPY